MFVCVCVRARSRVRACVCVCRRKPECLHETFFKLPNLFGRFWEMFRKRNDNTELPTPIFTCVCVS
jgi:hypothetical protein